MKPNILPLIDFSQKYPIGKRSTVKGQTVESPPLTIGSAKNTSRLGSCPRRFACSFGFRTGLSVKSGPVFRAHVIQGAITRYRIVTLGAVLWRPRLQSCFLFGESQTAHENHSPSRPFFILLQSVSHDLLLEKQTNRVREKRFFRGLHVILFWNFCFIRGIVDVILGQRISANSLHNLLQ